MEAAFAAALDVSGGAAPADEYDARFEFDAPRFYDFGSGSPQGQAAADAWFETSATKGLASPDAAAAMADPPEVTSTAPDQPAQVQQQQPAAQPARPTKASGKAGKGVTAAAGSRHALAPLTNMAPLMMAAPVQPKAKAAAAPLRQKQKSGTTAPDPQQQDKGKPAAEPSSSKQQAPAPQADAQQQQQQQEPAGAEMRSRQGAAAAAGSGRHRSTVPASPHLHARLRPGHHEVKTTEQMELEQLQREREEAAALRRRNAEAIKHVLQPPPPPAVHSSKPLTEPVEVQLRTSKRQRAHGMETRSMAGSGDDEGSSAAAGGGSSAAGGGAAGAKKKKTAVGAPSGLTVPMSPAFATKKRLRPPRFKPREVVEEEEMAAMPKFKARPWSRDEIMERGKATVPWVPPKPPTAPEPFHLKTDIRALEHGGSSAAGSGSGGGEPFVFKAAAGGGAAGRVTTRSRAKKQGWTRQLTHPQPFALATDARADAKRGAAGGADEQHQQHEQARPAKRARRGRKGGGTDITDPKPFQLATDARGEQAQMQLEVQRAAQEEAARRAAEFHARPLNRAVLEQPSVAGPIPSELTMPQDPHLATRTRAEARAEFDEQQAERLAARAAAKAAAEEEKRRAEEQLLRELRRELVHKPRPLPDGRIPEGRAL